MRFQCLVLLFFIAIFAHGQQPVPTVPPRFDVGTIDAGFYINHCLGFSYPIPEGWEINSQALGTPSGVAKQQPGGDLILLIADQHTKRPVFNRMVLTATNASALKFDTAEFVSRFVHAQAKDDPSLKILKEAYAVDFAGKQFFRSDFTDQHSGAILYKAFLSTRFRGYFLGWTIVAGTTDELDSAAQSLQKIVFQQDQPDPSCAVPPPVTTTAGVKSGVVVTPPVRISPTVAQSLLVKTIEPRYPEAARQQHIQGEVVVQGNIDTNGDVQNLKAISGNPVLIPAALEAVQLWKYKPFLLDGRPIEAETQITVRVVPQGQ